MALVLADRVRETTSTTGTGTLTLTGPFSGFRAFSAIGDGNTTYYAIADANTGEWEVGVGTYSTSGNTLSRDTVLDSSNTGSLVVFAAGVKDVICTQPAERAVYLEAAGTSTIVPGITISGLTASTALALDASKNAVSIANTGTGSNVLNTSPTLVTPALGTPSSGVVTNLTGTASININGTVGATTAAAGAFTTLGATGTSTLAAVNSGALAVTGAISSTAGASFATSSGNVGIGTSSPVGLLQVNGLASAVDVLRLTNAVDAALQQEVGIGFGPSGPTNTNPSAAIRALEFDASDSRASLLFYTRSLNTDSAPVERMRIDSAGNVGIGTSSPAAKLHVVGNALLGAGPPDTSLTPTYAGTFFGFDSGTNTVVIQAVNPSTAQLAFHTKSGSGVAPSERMRINSAGNVGIGTSSPAYKLEVQTNAIGAALWAQTGGTTSSYTIADFRTGTNLSALQLFGDGTSVWLGGAMRIDSTGNVGIGTSSPGKKLDVNGDALISGLTVGKGAGAISSNTALGSGALNSNTTGSGNTASGRDALVLNTTGINNTANGANALRNNTTGNNNTASGLQALQNNTTGFNNTASGRDALLSNTTGNSNTANGMDALRNNTTGILNTASGVNALYNNTTGGSNTANGVSALFNNTTTVGTLGAVTGGTGYTDGTYTAVTLTRLSGGTIGTAPTGTVTVAGGVVTTVTLTTPGNQFQDTTTILTASAASIGGTGSGFQVLVATLLAGNQNTALGASALQLNTTGSDNTASGRDALFLNTTGSSNTANGRSALRNNTTGGSNTAYGQSALNTPVTGSNATAIGFESQRYANDTATAYTSTNTSVGFQSLRGSTTAANNTGLNNTALGYQALLSNTTGSNNTANGVNALNANTTGTQNTASGQGALFSNTTGTSNTASGQGALQNNTTGISNTASGQGALFSNTTGTSNTASGQGALFSNTTGSGNTASGRDALVLNTTGNDNTASGQGALRNNTTGTSNTASGTSALFSNTTGVSNTASGYQALLSNTTGSGNTGINPRNSAGSYAPVFNPTTENNRFCMGSTGVTNAYIQVAWTVVSDARDKINFAPVPHGLEFVKALQPTAYQFRTARDSEETNGGVRYGFKAQDVLALEGANPVIVDNEDADKLRMIDTALIPVLVKAIQEQQALIESLTTRLTALESNP